MNNLILAAFLLMSTATLWWAQHRTLQAVRLTYQQAGAKLAALRTQRDEITAACTNTQATLKERRQQLAATRAELAAAEEETRRAQPFPPDPAKEGLWPTNKPYLLMAKRLLGSVEYPAIEPGYRLSDTAASLFGMSAAEQASVNNSLQAFDEAARRIFVDKAKPIEPAGGANTPGHQEVAFRVEATADEMRVLGEDFNEAVQATLGPDRAGVFLEQAGAAIEQSQYLYQHRDQGFEIKLTADRQANGELSHQLQVSIQDPDGGSSHYGSGIQYPLEPGSALWNYRDLFGDQPLITGEARQSTGP